MRRPGLDIAFFASSLVSSYWNGAATYYRGIVRALHERGHRVAFFEPDIYQRQQNRDIPDPEWARVHVYPAESEAEVIRTVERARSADLVVKASGVGAWDELLERAVLDLQAPARSVVFWDVDAPATLERVHANAADPFRALIPRYDLILTYGGGPPVVSAYTKLGARQCVPIYNGLDPATHFPVPRDPAWSFRFGFLGNRLPDREARVEAFFFEAARRLPAASFLLGGAGWDDKPKPPNVRYIGHVPTERHNAFNCSPDAVLNINRDSMARFGFSPPTRVFEAAGAGACLITDAWAGIEEFFEPADAGRIGEAALRRALAEHTYARRVDQLLATLGATAPVS
jgi:spore maturation protein CgeB